MTHTHCKNIIFRFAYYEEGLLYNINIAKVYKKSKKKEKKSSPFVFRFSRPLGGNDRPPVTGRPTSRRKVSSRD